MNASPSTHRKESQAFWINPEGDSVIQHPGIRVLLEYIGKLRIEIPKNERLIVKIRQIRSMSDTIGRDSRDIASSCRTVKSLMSSIEQISHTLDLGTKMQFSLGTSGLGDEQFQIEEVSL